MATLFTQIIRGEIPCYKVAENDEFFAFLDISPVQRGHTLVVPKLEEDYIFDLPPHILQNMLPFAQEVAQAIKQCIPCRRVGIAVLGLEVPHAHMHLIPIQKEGDMLMTHKLLPAPTPEEQEKLAAQLRKALPHLA